jgi:hypothetical protein
MTRTDQLVNRADGLVDQAADRLREFADRAAQQGGIAGMLADELADDAAFLRRLKPSAIVARAKGEAPKDLPAGTGTPPTTSRPLVGATPNPNPGTGVSPLLIVGAAFVVGIALAKLIDWRANGSSGD